ncbi:hypothetical protein HYFRA_00010388 [Hymenoscyphus fraxineus]|uniref:CND01770-like protein n=1 Tax=Hymenoscyphus fraxineus TaxID=746836 RepID=A0A9N9L5S6_9HELO|nr:hypothetical protein HYFRA_00010388 [Hymenoscyphus fraxineus]
MYIPNPQQILSAAKNPNPTSIAHGQVLDYAIEKCLDDDGNIRCTKPFPVQEDKCYTVEWKTKGVVSHTTLEVRDAGSGEVVYYRDTNGEWTPEKGELVYLDFKPKVWKTGNDTVEYVVRTCN